MTKVPHPYELYNDSYNIICLKNMGAFREFNFSLDQEKASFFFGYSDMETKQGANQIGNNACLLILEDHNYVKMIFSEVI